MCRIRWAVHLHLILSTPDVVTTSFQVTFFFPLGVQTKPCIRIFSQAIVPMSYKHLFLTFLICREYVSCKNQKHVSGKVQEMYFCTRKGACNFYKRVFSVKSKTFTDTSTHDNSVERSPHFYHIGCFSYPKSDYPGCRQT